MNLDITSMKNQKVWMYGTIIVALALALSFYWYFSRTESSVNTEEAIDAISQSTQIQTETNPVKTVPDINPTEKTNPFKTRNPFE